VFVKFIIKQSGEIVAMAKQNKKPKLLHLNVWGQQKKVSVAKTEQPIRTKDVTCINNFKNQLKIL
jgi:hypothetical protein